LCVYTNYILEINSSNLELLEYKFDIFLTHLTDPGDDAWWETQSWQHLRGLRGLRGHGLRGQSAHGNMLDYLIKIRKRPMKVSVLWSASSHKRRRC
jgi:hypothetical protein